jgi:hypothetical protein
MPPGWQIAPDKRLWEVIAIAPVDGQLRRNSLGWKTRNL